jgi:hypothetical protein
MYIDITNVLLGLLYEENEYHEVLHYGSGSLVHEPGNAEAYY